LERNEAKGETLRTDRVMSDTGRQAVLSRMQLQPNQTDLNEKKIREDGSGCCCLRKLAKTNRDCIRTDSQENDASTGRGPDAETDKDKKSQPDIV
jgi:hypothetical protein